MIKTVFQHLKCIMSKGDLITSTRTVGEWNKLWDENLIPFHKKEVHRLLEANVDKLVAGRENIKVLFPLCGKALDMKWLGDRGHTVIGVESSEVAVKQFLEESGEEYTVGKDASGKFTLYKGQSGRYRMYVGDLFDFSCEVEAGVQGVWDRGSLVALNNDDRGRYVSIMTSVLAPDCRYMLVTYDYDQSVYPGPPKSIPLATVQELYGEACAVERLEYNEYNNAGFLANTPTTCHEQLFLLTPK